MKVTKLQNLIEQWHELFHVKTLVYTNQYAPGELVEKFRAYGIRYVRIAFTNQVKHIGTRPTTDVPLYNVTEIHRLPCRAERIICKWLGRKPRRRIITLNNQV